MQSEPEAWESKLTRLHLLVCMVGEPGWCILHQCVVHPAGVRAAATTAAEDGDEEK